MTDDELRKLLAEATPGPWEVDPENVGKCISWCWQLRTEYGGTPIYVETQSRSYDGFRSNKATAEIAAAAPDLAAEVLRLREALHLVATAPTDSPEELHEMVWRMAHVARDALAGDDDT